jgi:hypothetical protein
MPGPICHRSRRPTCAHFAQAQPWNSSRSSAPPLRPQRPEGRLTSTSRSPLAQQRGHIGGIDLSLATLAAHKKSRKPFQKNGLSSRCDRIRTCDLLTPSHWMPVLQSERVENIVPTLQTSAYLLSGRPVGWSGGDFTSDGYVDQLDIVAALRTGVYLQGPYFATVPEPATVELVFVVLLFQAVRSRRRPARPPGSARRRGVLRQHARAGQAAG